MRILAVAHLWPNEVEPRYGIFVSRQLEAMAAQGADITLLVPRLYCPTWMRRLFKKPASYNHTLALADVPGVTAIPIPYVGFPGQWFNRYSGLSVFTSIRGKAKRLHQREPFDVIYATELFLNGDAARRLSDELKIPVACLSIGSDINVTAQATQALRKHFANIVRSVDGTLACGQSAADDMLKIGPKRDTLCVYGVVDLERFRPVKDKQSIRRSLGLPEDKQLVLYVGYLWKRKGLRELFQAFESVLAAQPNTKLLVCGAGDEEKAIKEAAANSKAEQSVQFIGSVDPDEIHKYMQAADVFTLPSYAEGMPNAVMEAMACGLPVVTTSVGGLPAALAGNDGAILVPPRDVASLAKALTSLLSDAEKQSRMGIAARELAERDFGVQRSAQRILEYLAIVADINSSVSATQSVDAASIQ